MNESDLDDLLKEKTANFTPILAVRDELHPIAVNAQKQKYKLLTTLIGLYRSKGLDDTKVYERVNYFLLYTKRYEQLSPNKLLFEHFAPGDTSKDYFIGGWIWIPSREELSEYYRRAQGDKQLLEESAKKIYNKFK